MTSNVFPRCEVREHAGIEKVMQRIGLGAPLMPDPELGQDVAFLAHVITTLQKAVDGKPGIVVDKKKLKDYLTKLSDEAAEQIKGLNRDLPIFKTYDARLCMAKQLIQLIDVGEFM